MDKGRPASLAAWPAPAPRLRSAAPPLPAAAGCGQTYSSDQLLPALVRCLDVVKPPKGRKCVLEFASAYIGMGEMGRGAPPRAAAAALRRPCCARAAAVGVAAASERRLEHERGPPGSG
jgi:hypothetical protein